MHVITFAPELFLSASIGTCVYEPVPMIRSIDSDFMDVFTGNRYRPKYRIQSMSPRENAPGFTVRKVTSTGVAVVNAASIPFVCFS